MSKTKWYGCLGFLSLLGLVGVLTPQREFLSFFAFAVDFEYFFLPSDEMVEQYMNRSAARGFVAGDAGDGGGHRRQSAYRTAEQPCVVDRPALQDGRQRL